MSDSIQLYIIFATIIIGFQVAKNIKNLSSGAFEWFSSRNWSTTTGRVISAEVQSVSVPRYKRGARRYPDATMYKPVITYEYYVYAETFESDKIYVGADTFLTDFETAESIVTKYRESKTFVISYNPQKPGISFLERKIPKGFIGNILVSIFWLLFLLFSFLNHR